MKIFDLISITVFSILWIAFYYKDNTIQNWFSGFESDLVGIISPILTYIFIVIVSRVLKNKYLKQ